MRRRSGGNIRIAVRGRTGVLVSVASGESVWERPSAWVVDASGRTGATGPSGERLPEISAGRPLPFTSPL